MAEAASAAPLLRGLPDEVVIWEILPRLPPKSILRCRAVCPAWRRATSARDFLLAHHARQPALPILDGLNTVGKGIDIITFDHRSADQLQLQSVARLGATHHFGLEASCDGLLVLSIHDMSLGFAICNPATRQYAPLHLLYGSRLLGMYPHSPTGEYRLLLYLSSKIMHDEGEGASYIFTIGSGHQPRNIGCPDAKALIFTLSTLFRGSLHWHMKQQESASSRIMVFDTTAESFRQMRAPVVRGFGNLFEMDGMLGLSIIKDEQTSVDIWVMQDYEGQVWTFKARVELPIAEIRVQFGKFVDFWDVVAAPSDVDVQVLVKTDEWLLQVDTDGKLVASFHRRGLNPTQRRLKQSLVSHTFFPTQEVAYHFRESMLHVMFNLNISSRNETCTDKEKRGYHGHAQRCGVGVYNQKCGVDSLDIIPFDHRVGVAAADRLQSVARIADAFVRLCISCDGLVVFYIDWDHLCIVNPATRQFARLPSFTLTDTHHPAGIYPHSPTGEYRLLLAPTNHSGTYTRWPRYDRTAKEEALMFRRRLHWCIDSMIIVFDTTAECFWQMLAPVVLDGPGQFVMDKIYGAVLFEMNGMLGMSSLNADFTSVGIWAMQNYESKVWAFKYRFELPLAELTVQFGKFKPYCCWVPISWDGDVIVLLQFGEWLLQLDMDGKLIASLHHHSHKGLFPTQHRLKQTLVQHTFFPTLEGYVVNASPFI
ncbi:hypothetical protein VPH35_062949 [Triticum aestivum]